MKTCVICNIEKKFDDFEYQKGQKDKLSSSCRGCLQSARKKGNVRIPDGALCNVLNMSQKIINYDFEHVPECYHDLIHEQRKLKMELSRL